MNGLLPKARPLSRAWIDDYAERLVEALHPEIVKAESPVPVLDFCEFGYLEELIGVKCDVAELPFGAEACFNGKLLTLSVPTYMKVQAGDGRARFTVAHEIGHAFLHRHELQRANAGDSTDVRLYRHEDLKPYENPEWQADRFAGSFLMPSTAVKRIASACGPNNLCSSIAQRFQVSTAAAQVCVKRMNQDGKILRQK